MEHTERVTEAIILAGGFGTRLRSVVPDLPKPMAPVANRPFLEHILDELIGQGIERFILSTGYGHTIIHDHFASREQRYRGCPILYSREKTPLGTGGAIRKALKEATSDHVLAVNGDTLFRVSLDQLSQCHHRHHAVVTLALKPMPECQRYGVVQCNDTGRITQFLEKGDHSGPGQINGGVYLLEAGALQEQPEQFSFERDFLERMVEQHPLMGHACDGYFIDMGIPEDYARAQRELTTEQSA
ncbi:MAG: nucleotidyltransferase family protein [Magnetococcales bacterium]|nr:nucleotidyltransferase family protein [Magnetococcales bacterium]